MSQISPPPPRRAALASPGGKASRLLELQRAGFKVPAFVCAPADVEDAIRTLGVPLAVRSSASAEDGRNASFAGQFKSFLGLRTAEEVTSAISACDASVREDSVVR
jgi:phosphoenolpyruvate synthase/pyruvate phosphate dikinase